MTALHKVAHFEYQYQLRDKAEEDKSLPKMNSLGSRYPKLFQKMINILGSRQNATSMINEKIEKEEMTVGKDQSHLTTKTKEGTCWKEEQWWRTKE